MQKKPYLVIIFPAFGSGENYVVSIFRYCMAHVNYVVFKYLDINRV